MSTKKVGTSGRLGPRYGRKIRGRVAEIEGRIKTGYECPRCGASRLKRLACGIWLCKKCGVKFAGGAYTPDTSMSRMPSVAEEVKTG